MNPLFCKFTIKLWDDFGFFFSFYLDWITIFGGGTVLRAGSPRSQGLIGIQFGVVSNGMDEMSVPNA